MIVADVVVVHQQRRQHQPCAIDIELPFKHIDMADTVKDNNNNSDSKFQQNVAGALAVASAESNCQQPVCACECVCGCILGTGWAIDDANGIWHAELPLLHAYECCVARLATQYATD